MSDDQPPPLARALVTAEFLAENERKQAAYAAIRHAHNERLARIARGDESEDPASPGPAKPRGRIPDKRQLGFDV